MHEALSRLDGVTSISESPDPVAWTCEMTARDGRLPSLAGIARAVRAVGSPFSVRGIEAVVEGSVELSPAGPILRAFRTGETFALAPATRKVQWDSRTRKNPPITSRERSAYDRLASEVLAPGTGVRVTGRVEGAGPSLSPVLEVREFHALPENRVP